MTQYDDKYREEGEEADSHVRGIINQLNKEHPSKEKKREVVVRPDGTKVIRVTKKRRVMVTEAQKRRKSRRTFLFILLFLVLASAALVGFTFFGMTSMSGEQYVQKKAEELKAAWGASSLAVSGMGVDGTELHLTTIVATFPEDSIVQRVEMSDISATLDVAGFLTRRVIGDELSIGRIELRLNPEVKTLKMPRFNGSDLWRFSRVDCKHFFASFGEGENTNGLRDVQAYMYYPRPSDRTACAVTFSGGELHLLGTPTIRLKAAKLLLDPTGVQEFSFAGTTDQPTNGAGQQEESSLMIAGRVMEGDSLAGPFEFDSSNMPLASFTGGRVANILTARTEPQAVGRDHSPSRILLPFEKKAPEYSGEFRLKNISLIGFPAETLLLDHLAASKRKDYQPARIMRGMVVLRPEGDTLTIDIPEDAMVERDLLSLRGSIALSADNELSGKLDYGLPTLLTHQEYADGHSDPIFREDADTAWLCTTISGTPNVPSDDSARLNAEAETARAQRTDRLNLEDVDLEKVAEQLKKEQEAVEGAIETNEEADKRKKRELDNDPFANPLE